jgi:hypothetical protein
MCVLNSFAQADHWYQFLNPSEGITQMKRATFPLLVILILAAIVATTSTSAAIVPEHGPSAFGAGQFRFPSQSGDRIEFWRFSFEAIANKNGHTRGRAQFENLTAQTQVAVRINCLSVGTDVGKAFAVMSGTVLHSDHPALPKLETVVFVATDGSLLPTSGADTISPPFVLPPFFGEDCRDTQPLTMLPVEDGDIQIQL